MKLPDALVSVTTSVPFSCRYAMTFCSLEVLLLVVHHQFANVIFLSSGSGGTIGSDFRLIFTDAEASPPSSVRPLESCTVSAS